VSDSVRALADIEGLPRRNGELIFEAPWQGRAFGMAVAFTKSGGTDWEDFRQLLIAEIATDADGGYYASWLRAFERLLVQRKAVTVGEIEGRKSEYISMEREGVF
jgi:nitrile hydratase accessory protein